MTDADAQSDLDWRCYRHPDRDAGVKCRRCERAICPDCMVTAPVGFQCRECVKKAPPVRNLRSLQQRPVVTLVLIAVNVLAYLPALAGGGAVLGRSGNELAPDFALFGPAVAAGEWYRIVTSGFLHYGLIHLGFNMYILWMLGQSLEQSLGRVRFGLLYLAALLAGSLGVLLLDPRALTAGASGAVFGCMGAAILGMRRRGIDPMQSGLVGLLFINLLLTFAVPGISVGGHVGGLIGGAAVGALLFATDDAPATRAGGAVAVVAICGALTAAALWVASNPV